MSSHRRIDGAGSVYHTSKIITTAGVDLQTMGKDFLWVGRAETRLKQLLGGVNGDRLIGVTAARQGQEYGFAA